MALPSGERRVATRPERLPDAVEVISGHNCPDVSLTQQAATGGFINLMSYCDHRHPGLSATRPDVKARRRRGHYLGATSGSSTPYSTPVDVNAVVCGDGSGGPQVATESKPSVALTEPQIHTSFRTRCHVDLNRNETDSVTQISGSLIHSPWQHGRSDRQITGRAIHRN
jgi:hypothetical protein